MRLRLARHSMAVYQRLLIAKMKLAIVAVAFAFP